MELFEGERFMKKLLSAFFCLFITTVGLAYVPEDYAVFFVRGLNSNELLPPILQAFQQEFPTIPIVVAKIGDGSAATTNRGLYHQLDDISNDALTNPLLRGKRVIVIGSSQGGLLARSFIEKYGDVVPFTIDSFMSCASPQGGEYGLPDGWKDFVHRVIWGADVNLLQQITSLLGISGATIDGGSLGTVTIASAIATIRSETLSRDIFDPIRAAIESIVNSIVENDWPLVRIIFYNFIGQDLVSVANYWKDPLHKADYLAFNTFLPYFNNDINHANSARYKANLQNLNYIIMLWAGRDFVVKPDCSGAFRFYEWGSATVVEPVFTGTTQYTQNLLGLRDMYDNGHLFFESPQGMGHGCDGPGIPVAMNYLRNIVNNTPPNEIFDAVKNNNLAYVQQLVTADNTLVYKRNGFGLLPIYYAGNKPAIAQYLFAQALALGHPVPLVDQASLLINAFGSGSLAVAQWLIEQLYFNPTSMKDQLIKVANENHQSAMVNYIQNLVPQSLTNAIIQNNLPLVTQIVTANPVLINEITEGMLPIYYAGNKLAIAQYLFSAHLQYGLLSLTQLSQLLIFAFGSGSLPVAQWIIEELYFDPTPYQATLMTTAQNNYQYSLLTYLNTFLASGRATIFGAVQNNNLALVTFITTCNPANIEQIDAYEMLPILYAGNKLDIAQYLYNQHNANGRPLSDVVMNRLLYYAFGSGSLPVAQWILETLHLVPSSVQSLVSIASAQGHPQMIDYLRSLGLI